MEIRPIRTDADLETALSEVNRLMDLDPPEGTTEFDRMDIMATLIDAYEAEHYAIEYPHPIEAIRARMAEKGINQRALGLVTGFAESKISEVLSLRRPLSLPMIRQVADALDLPIEVLVQPYPLNEATAA